MPKKNFKNNPALAFIQPQQKQEEAQDVTQEEVQDEAHEAQDVAQEKAQNVTHDETHDEAHEAQDVVQDETQEAVQPAERRNYIRTQGQKGHKKPRINLAFDSEAFLDKIRIRAEREGKSITQFVNDAVAYYMETTRGSGRK